MIYLQLIRVVFLSVVFTVLIYINIVYTCFIDISILHSYK